jgi:hypothetical protein
MCVPALIAVEAPLSLGLDWARNWRVLEDN